MVNREELRVRNEPGNSWKAFDKFKAIRLLGKQPLDVLDDPIGDLLVIFLACHQINRTDKSPFSELCCEVDDNRFATVCARLVRMDFDGYRPAGEHESRLLLIDLVKQNTDRLKRLASKHKRRT
jgi:hypothetical protein